MGIWGFGGWGFFLSFSMLLVSGCAGSGPTGQYSTHFGANFNQLHPEKEVLLDTIPVDFTKEKKAGISDLTRDDLMERFQDSERTNLVQGSFFIMNNEKLASEDVEKLNVKWITHGNWCGINRPESRNPPVLDELDRACRQHKICYRQTWDQNCGCDDKFISRVSEMKEISTDIKKNLVDYYLNSRCVFKCRYLVKWKDAYKFEEGEGRIPKNIKKQFGMMWTVAKLKGKRTVYISRSQGFNFVCFEDPMIFDSFVNCAKNKAGSLSRLQCLENSYIKKGIVMYIDWDASGPRDTNILHE